MLSATLSLVLNIGEAGGRRGPAESAQHLRGARGSAFESAAMLYPLTPHCIIDDETYNAQEHLLSRIGAMLSTMIRTKTAPQP